MVPGSRAAALSRMRRYRDYCSTHSIPCFPVVGSVIALWIYHRKSQSEGNYASDESVLNMVRKATWEVWSGRKGCEQAGQDVLRNEALSEFLGERRQWEVERRMEWAPEKGKM